MIGFFSRLLGRPSPRPVKPRVRLAVVVGHNHRAKGADSPWLPPEYDFNSVQAQRIADAAMRSKVNVRIFYRTPGGGYVREIERVYDEVDAWGPDYSVELHYNSARLEAQGTETLRAPTSGSRRLAEAIHPHVLRIFGRRDRGIKMLREGKRGFHAVMAGRAPAIIIEPAFGSSEQGARSLEQNWPGFAVELVREIEKLGNTQKGVVV